MISFRYHIVSIVSVFLALAVGIALGGGPLNRKVDNSLVDQVKRDRATRTSLLDRIDALRATDNFTDEFAGTVAPTLLGGTLRRHAVTVVALPNARQSDVTALKGLVSVAGGRVAGTLQVRSQLLDSGNRQLVDELGSQVESRTSGLSIPDSASPYERMGALLARAVGSRRRGGAAVDTSATSILAAMNAAKLVRADGALSRRGDLVLFVAGASDENDDRQQAAASIVTTLAQAVDARTRGVVLTGPTSSAQGDGDLATVRGDVRAARDVSTVDTVGRTAGQVVVMMALAQQARGGTGQYGALDAADGAMPGARAGSGSGG